nr:MAG TPA: hypothetical protein [Caudoviricetes sp.]
MVGMLTAYFFMPQRINLPLLADSSCVLLS